MREPLVVESRAWRHSKALDKTLQNHVSELKIEVTCEVKVRSKVKIRRFTESLVSTGGLPFTEDLSADGLLYTEDHLSTEGLLSTRTFSPTHGLLSSGGRPPLRRPPLHRASSLQRVSCLQSASHLQRTCLQSRGSQPFSVHSPFLSTGSSHSPPSPALNNSTLLKITLSVDIVPRLK